MTPQYPFALAYHAIYLSCYISLKVCHDWLLDHSSAFQVGTFYPTNPRFSVSL